MGRLDQSVTAVSQKNGVKQNLCCVSPSVKIPEDHTSNHSPHPSPHSSKAGNALVMSQLLQVSMGGGNRDKLFAPNFIKNIEESKAIT